MAERGVVLSKMHSLIGRTKGGTFWIDGDPRLIMRYRLWQWCLDPASADLMPPKEIVVGELERKFELHGPKWRLVTLTAADGDFPKQCEAQAMEMLKEFKESKTAPKN